VAATLAFGFGSVKMDRSGLIKNATLLAELYNQTGRRVLIENNNAVARRNPTTGGVDCPMHLFRTSADARPTFGSVLTNLMSVDPFNVGGLTGPGCWAHPDMLAVGVTAPQPPGALHRCAQPGVPCAMNLTEMRTNFGGWAIMSSPLILAMDLRDAAELDAVWPIVSNREVIGINQQWVGDAGRIHSASTVLALLPNCGSGKSCKRPSWLVLTKALPAAPTPVSAPATRVSARETAPVSAPPPARPRTSRAAVMLMNNGDRRANISVDLSASPGIVGLGSCDGDANAGGGCAVRDAWRGVDLSNVTTLITAELDPHDSLLLVVTSEGAAPPMPPPSPPPRPPGPAPLPPGQVVKGMLFDSSVAGNELVDTQTRKTADTLSCVAWCGKTPKCVGVSFRISLQHCWLHAGCAHPTTDRKFNSAVLKP
jgi:hypothetical protein